MINIVQAWSPLVVCSGADCHYSQLIVLAKNFMNNLMELSVIIATIGFIYIGFVFLTSGGKTEALSKAKNASWSILKGFFFVLAAWIIVYTITHTLLQNPNDYTLLR